MGRKFSWMAEGSSFQRLFWQAIPTDYGIAVSLRVSAEVKLKVFPCAKSSRLEWVGRAAAALASPAACSVTSCTPCFFWTLPSSSGKGEPWTNCSIWFFLALQFFNYALAIRNWAILTVFSEGWCSSCHTCHGAYLAGISHSLSTFPWWPLLLVVWVSQMK